MLVCKFLINVASVIVFSHLPSYNNIQVGFVTVFPICIFCFRFYELYSPFCPGVGAREPRSSDVRLKPVCEERAHQCAAGATEDGHWSAGVQLREGRSAV